jgi:hypothetical protein
MRYLAVCYWCVRFFGTFMGFLGFYGTRLSVAYRPVLSRVQYGERPARRPPKTLRPSNERSFMSQGVPEQRGMACYAAR